VERQFANSTFSIPIRDRLIAVNLKSHIYRTLRAENKAFNAELAQQREPPSLDDLPLIVITEGKPVDPYMVANLELWNELQEELKNLSGNSKRVIAANSPHAIHRYEPGLIVESVGEVLNAIRSGARIQ
jgi:hypothetical protein